MTSIPAPHARHGFTLLEMLAVMWANGLLLLIGCVLVNGMYSIRQATQTTHDRITRQSTLADRFRADVAVGTALPENGDGQDASPKVLILAVDGGTIVYAIEAGRVTRTATVDGKRTDTAFVLGKKVSAEFVRPTEPIDLVTLRLVESRTHGPARHSDIGAALGGDLR